MYKLSLFLVLSLIAVGCKQDHTLIQYDLGRSYVYFAYPETKTTTNGVYVDSVYYGFALDQDLQRKEITIGIPVRIGGLATPNDRTYKFVVEGTSRYDPGAVKFSTSVIAANQYEDTLFITFQRTSEMQSERTLLYLRLEENNEFLLGNLRNQKIEILVDDMLNEPTWWNVWSNYFGSYQKEIFQQWMQIYYLGADPSSELLTGAPGPFYYWNNMPPTSAIVSWYPVTFNYIQVLKQYFIDNTIYPSGDTTKPRILLP